MYYDFWFTDPRGTFTIVERPSENNVFVQVGKWHNFEANETLFDGAPGAPTFTLHGRARDADTNTSEVVGDWEMSFNQSSTTGDQIFFTRPLDAQADQRVYRLYMTWVELPTE